MGLFRQRRCRGIPCIGRMPSLQVYRCVLVTLAFAWAFAAMAGESPDLAVIGTGNLSCGAYAEARRNQNDEQVRLFVQWVDGFLVGYSYYASNKRVIPPDHDATMTWLDKWCAANPLKYVVTASAQLVQELGGAKAFHNMPRPQK